MDTSTVAAPSGSRPRRANRPALIGRGEVIRTLRSEIQLVAARPATVLIEGETGVGKELVAREIHAQSGRSTGPFLPADCTAFSGQLIESQLFGHVKGAFTGAVTSTLGFIRCADGGTLFLDEIGELPLELQSKLLRCLQERAVVPVGSAEHVPVDVRVIAATHRNLDEMVREGRFRQDLYFRLNVVRLRIAPLRRRPEDVVPLAMHFLDEIAYSYDEPAKSLDEGARNLLVQYAWPGNVRELRNMMERAHLFCGSRVIGAAHLPPEIRDAVSPTAARGGRPAHGNSIPSLAEAESLLVARALQAARGNQSAAARLLQVERHRLRRLIARHDLEHLLQTRA
jgi:transcriptional regulator with PAS, ATPase and Fis domain